MDIMTNIMTKEILMQADSQMADICMRGGAFGSGEEISAEAVTAIPDYLRFLMEKGVGSGETMGAVKKDMPAKDM